MLRQKSHPQYLRNSTKSTIFAFYEQPFMEIKFDKDYLRQLYEKGKADDKKHRYQPDIVTRYQARIKMLEQANGIEDLYPYKSLHYSIER